MPISLFQSSLVLLIPSHLIIMVSLVITPLCKPIKELTILKVDAGEKRCVSSCILYTVTFPSALFSNVKQPSTLFSSKYFFRLLSIFALFTLQEKRVISNKELVISDTVFFFIITINIKIFIEVLGFCLYVLQ